MPALSRPAFAASWRIDVRIEKHGAAITNLDEWLQHAGPKTPEKQWVEGRSAMEAARAWLEGAPNGPPKEIGDLLRSHMDFRNVVIDQVEPEARVSFDTRRGEPRNADLVIIGHDDYGPFAGSVEAIADETFDQRVSEVLDAALERTVANPRSGGVERVVELVRGLVPPRVPDSVSIGDLRYQLLTGVAGTLALAAEHHAARAVFIVHVFETDKTSSRRLEANANDANQFVRRLSSGAVSNLEDGVLVGPIHVRGAALSAKPAALYIGKATRRLSDPMS
jgi:hypothetical protein